jgi:uncharacterized protein
MAKIQTGHRVRVYLALVFPISWVLWIPVILEKTNPVFLNLSGGPALVAMWLSASHDGRRWSSARSTAFAVFVPLFWLVLTLNVGLDSNPPAPVRLNSGLLLPSAISAGIVSGAFSSNSGIRSLLRGPIAPLNWRWPMIALFIVPTFLLTTAALGRVLGLPGRNPAAGLTAIQLAAVIAIRFLHYLLFTAVFEEPGWRGFLLPRIQQRFSPLMASVLVWLPWAIWHLPLDFTRPGGWSVRAIVQQRGVVLLIFSIVITWLYNRSGGSLLCAAIFHASTGSFLYALHSCAPVMIPLAVVLAAAAVISNRMWLKLPQAADARYSAASSA